MRRMEPPLYEREIATFLKHGHWPATNEALEAGYQEQIARAFLQEAQARYGKRLKVRDPVSAWTVHLLILFIIAVLTCLFCRLVFM